MNIIPQSHLDHGLLDVHRTLILDRFGDRSAFFAETIELPDGIPSLLCGLHGPIMGDAPVPDTECRMVVRTGRKGPSRTCNRPRREVRTMTVVGGPYDDDPCVLYTAFGGPLATREPFDVGDDPVALAESHAFWSEHALTAPLDRLLSLAATFPSLARRGVRSRVDLLAIADDENAGTGSRYAARFVVSIATGQLFDLHRAWGAWDDKHRAAWQAWAAAPWWA